AGAGLLAGARAPSECPPAHAAPGLACGQIGWRDGDRRLPAAAMVESATRGGRFSQPLSLSRSIAGHDDITERMPLPRGADCIRKTSSAASTNGRAEKRSGTAATADHRRDG